MSGNPENLADEGAAPLWAGWYAGPARADGRPRWRLQLLRHQPDEERVSLSLDEVARLLGGIPEGGPPECGEEEDSTGYGLRCSLPEGHEGTHMGSAWWP